MSDVAEESGAGRGDVALPARLPCGTLVDDLMAQVADAGGDLSGGEAGRERRAHQLHCPHCRAMLAELREVWAPVTELAAQPVAIPASLNRTVMERVSALASHGWHAVVEEDPGTTRIAAWVIAVIARRAASSVLGVATVRGRVLPTDPAVASVQARYVAPATRTQQQLAAGVGVAGRKVVVRVEITAADVPTSLPVLAGQVRRAVIEHVRAVTGLEVVEVDVHVSDIGARPPEDDGDAP